MKLVLSTAPYHPSPQQVDLEARRARAELLKSAGAALRRGLTRLFARRPVGSPAART